MDTDSDIILYQHTVLCQTCLPYRNPGDSVRRWERTNGRVGLQLDAGEAWHPEIGRFVKLGLPYGPKPRLLLAYLNREALIQQSPEIEVEGSLTAFVKSLRLDPSGRNIGTIKDQLARLSASTIRLGGINREGESVTINTGIVSAFQLWLPKDERQRVLWPSTVHLSPEYYASLRSHAVPLSDGALAALAHSAMGLDIYAWLAQRLHRINKTSFVPWASVHGQFGANYVRMDHFKPVFRRALGLVLDQYPTAKISLDGRGLTLHQSPPPIQNRPRIEHPHLTRETCG